MRILLLLCLSACGGSSLSANPDLGPASTYQDEPWSVHLYALNGAIRAGQNLRLFLVHNPDNEGNADDQTVPPAHDYTQQLTVELPFDAAAKQFLCVVLAPSLTPPSYAVDDLSAVDHGSYTLLHDGSGDWLEKPANLKDMCGANLTSVSSRLQLSRAALPDLALMIPLLPDPRQLTAGAAVDGWLARGVLYNDEDGELVPAVHATVVAVQ